MNWVVKIAGQMFDAPETVALVRALTKLQKQPLFYLAYPRAIPTGLARCQARSESFVHEQSSYW